MQQKLLKKTAFLTCIFAVVSLGLIIGTASLRLPSAKEVSQEETSKFENTDGTLMEKTETGHELLFDEDETLDFLSIPLPAGSNEEDISIENQYMNRKLYVLVRDADESFYAENTLTGNRDAIDLGRYEKTRDGILLAFDLDGIYEYYTNYEEGELCISFLNPRSVYDRIVVIDPSCGGEDTGYKHNSVTEKDLTLQIVMKLKEKLDDSEIKAYYTRLDDTDPAEEDRIALANDLKADMYIAISADMQEDESVYGASTIYNDEYFIPGFGSVELADLLEKELVSAIKTKALGIQKASSENKLHYARIPAAEVRVGCLSNKKEAALLDQEDYIEKIADGIYNAIVSAYENYEWTD